MNAREKVIASALFTILILSWLSFVFHADRRFAGSLSGGMLGIAAAFLMLAPFLYILIKRVPWIKHVLTRAMPMSGFLRLHIYAGILGSILALIHSGHKFDSGLGLLLTIVMLTVVISGFAGRYFMTYLAEDTREKRTLLSQLEQQYHAAALALAGRAERGAALRALARSWTLGRAAETLPELRLAKNLHDLSESLADVEYALETENRAKLLFSRWMTLHILLSFLFLILLAMHIWSGFYFGIRWLQ